MNNSASSVTATMQTTTPVGRVRRTAPQVSRGMDTGSQCGQPTDTRAHMHVVTTKAERVHTWSVSR